MTPRPPVILAENHFDTTVLHPGAVLTAEGGEAAGAEAFRVADNLRDMTCWTSGAPNARAALTVDCGAPAAASALVLDRGHNLAGHTVALRASADGVTYHDVVRCVVPAAAGGLPWDAAGCVTKEGAWWRRFAEVSWRFWQLEVPAMGAGLAPLVTGLYVGAAYEFPEFLEAPAAYDYRTRVVHRKTELSLGGVRVKTRGINFGVIDLRLDVEGEDYAGFDAQVRRLLELGHPWWFCLDEGDELQAGLCRLFQTPGDVDYDPQANPVHREIALELETVIPPLAL